MPLTRKVTLIVIILFLVSGLFSLLIQRMVIMPSFLDLEKETANQNAERALQAIGRELDQIVPSVSDWAYWTDTYQYAKGEMPEYVDDNLEVGTTLEGVKMNFMGIYDTAGKAVWTQAVDLDTGEQVDLGELTGTALGGNHPLLQQPSLTGEVQGLIRTTQAPMLVVAKNILTTDREGPAAGIVVMGRFLNATAIELLADQIKLPLAITPHDSPAVADWIGGIKRGLAHTEIRLSQSTDSWQARSIMSDLYGRPILTMQVDTGREISARGEVSVNIALWSLAATGLLTMFVLWLLLRTTLLRPLSQLTDHAVRIGTEGDLHSKLGLKRKDEIGLLAQTFDNMMDQLAEARRCLVDQSFRSGIAEMASGVLHNIGNAVTPLTVKLSLLNQDLGAAPIAEMKQAVTELADPATPSDRRGDLTQFVELAGGELAELVSRSQQEIASAAQMIVHVQEILSDQERFSRSARIIEPVDMIATVRDAAAGLTPEMKAYLKIDIEPSIAATGAVAGARAALQQVVTNLLINAAESIKDAGSRPGWVRISATRQDQEGRAMMHLVLQDNGAGIQADHLGRLFERGFSTKQRDGSGYGLHWSANTVQALGGRIEAESAGSGKGATFHLWLPIANTMGQASSEMDGRA